MNRKALLVFIVLLLLLLKSNLALSEEQQASNSSQFHGDERHNGFIASIGPTSPIITWKINQKCDGMIASNGRLFVVNEWNDIYVINETNGVKLRDIQASMRSDYPVTGMGNIFFSYYDGWWHDYITAENIFSLNEEWRVNVKPKGGARYIHPFDSYLLAYSKGKLFEAFSYASINDSELHARIASSGTFLWGVKFEGYIIGTIPTVADDVVVIGFLDHPKITALSTDNGTILWNFTTDSPVLSSPAYSSNYFYFGSTNGVVYAVSKDGKELWHTKLGSNIETTPAVAFGKVFVGADDGNLYVLNATSGKLVWKYPTKEPIIASPIVSINEIVYVGSTDGKIYALNAENGSIVWNDNTNASIEVTPVLDNGMLFVASSDGIIRAYYTANMSSNPTTTTGTQTVTVTQTITNTQTVTATKTVTLSTTITGTQTVTQTITNTQTVTATKTVWITVPVTNNTQVATQSVTTISPLNHDYSAIVVVIMALAMILILAIIWLWLRRMWGKM